ncbi:hypothetical protein U1Q18_019404 [Sarracenia purpurea var. burkii]
MPKLILFDFSDNTRRKQQNRQQGLKPLKLQAQGITGFGNCKGDFEREDDGGAGLVTDRRCGDRRNPGRAQEERIPVLCSAQGLGSSGLGFGSTQREEDGNSEV